MKCELTGLSEFGLFECTVFTVSVFYKPKWTRFSIVFMMCNGYISVMYMKFCYCVLSLPTERFWVCLQWLCIEPLDLAVGSLVLYWNPSRVLHTWQGKQSLSIHQSKHQTVHQQIVLVKLNHLRTMHLKTILWQK